MPSSKDVSTFNIVLGGKLEPNFDGKGRWASYKRVTKGDKTCMGGKDLIKKKNSSKTYNTDYNMVLLVVFDFKVTIQITIFSQCSSLYGVWVTHWPITCAAK